MIPHVLLFFKYLLGISLNFRVSALLFPLLQCFPLLLSHQVSFSHLPQFQAKLFSPSLDSTHCPWPHLLWIYPQTLLFLHSPPNTHTALLAFCTLSSMMRWTIHPPNVQDPSEGRECARRRWLTCAFQRVDGPYSRQRAGEPSHPSPGYVAWLAGVHYLLPWIIWNF